AHVVRLADRAVLRVTGEDRLTWLNGVVTCDIAKLGEGAAQYGLAVSPKGRVLADFWVVRTKDALLLTLPITEAENVKTALEKYMVMEDCELSIESDLAIYSVVGKGSAPALGFARDVASAHAATVGPFGGVVIVPCADAAALEAAFAKSGAVVGGASTREVLRHEGGVPAFGVDFDGTTYPQEAGLEKRAVAFDKGCYLGQEVICMLEMRGHVKRKLVSLSVEGTDLPIKGAEVTNEAGEKVGEVTSAATSPELGVLALAMVKSAATTPGAVLKIGAANAKVRDLESGALS
ncbi:MAG TPA: glycine cleavage T C-terminal barrel domain-containing protein, partial [Polyangiaceae bacterium]